MEVCVYGGLSSTYVQRLEPCPLGSSLGMALAAEQATYNIKQGGYYGRVTRS